MKGLTPKADFTVGPQGELTAAEFNDMRNDAQNLVTNSGQTLTVATGDDNEQLTKGVAVGGRRVSLGDGATARIGDIVLPDNSASPITIDLPNAGLFVNASVDFEQVEFQIYSVRSVTIGRNGNTIFGVSEDLVLDNGFADNKKIRLSWDGSTWTVNIIGVIGGA